MPHEALIIIDVQNDFCPGGALAVSDGDCVVPVINRLQDCYDARILTQDWHPADHSSFAAHHDDAAEYSVVEMSYGSQVLWPRHCIQGTAGAEFHAALRADADLIIRKGFRPDIDSYSAFFENDHETPTGLAGYLRDRGIDSLVMAGLATDFCVRYSAVDAAKLGFSVAVVEDACRAIDLDGSLDAALAEMDAHGVRRVSSSSLG